MSTLRTLRYGFICTSVAVIALTTAELTLRAFDYGSPREVFRLERDAAGQTWAKANREVFDLERLTGISLNTTACRLPKPDETFRVISLGASTTYGRPYEHRGSFSFFLERLLEELPETLGNRVPEVLNAGLPAASSREVLRIGIAALELEPDILILYAGHNDFGHYSRTDGFTTGLQRFLSDLELTELLGQVIPRDIEVAGPDALERFGSVDPNGSAARRVIENFERNIEELVKTARSKGVPVIVIAPASNLRSWPPNRSVGVRGLRPIQATRFENHRTSARLAFGERDLHRVLRELDAAAAIQPLDATTQFERGLCLEALRRFDDAAQAFRSARDLDALPLRATQAIRRSLRNIAQRSDLPLLDAESVLMARTQPRVPGEDLFIDNVHPYLEGHAILAEAIHRVLVENRYWRGPLPPGRPFDASRWLSPQEEVQAFLLTGEYLYRFGRAQDAERMFRRALERQPTLAESWIRWARFLARLDRVEEANAAFERAGQLAPERGEEIQTYQGHLLAPKDR